MPTVATVGITARKSVAVSGSLIVDDENLVTQAALDGVGLLCCRKNVLRRIWRAALCWACWGAGVNPLQASFSTIQADGNSRPPSSALIETLRM
jgi:hypothetical protein